jgi:hypothetical protein
MPLLVSGLQSTQLQVIMEVVMASLSQLLYSGSEISMPGVHSNRTWIFHHENNLALGKNGELMF